MKTAVSVGTLSLALVTPVLGQTFTVLDQMLVRGFSRDGTTAVGNQRGGGGGIGARWNAADGYTFYSGVPGLGARIGPDSISEDARYLAGMTNREQGPWGLFRFDTVTNAGEYLGTYGGYQNIITRGVSRDGEVIAGYGFSPSFNAYQALYWTRSGGIRPLTGVFGASVVNDMSSDGRVIVGQGDVQTSRAAFRWTEAEGAVELEKLDPTLTSQALATNAVGDLIVGASSYRNGDFNFQDAVLWENDRIVRRLPVLAGHRSMRAMTLSDDGSVIGGLADTGIAFTAFIWTEATGTITLQSYLESFGVVTHGTVYFSGEFRISGDGRTFMSTEGWVATIPTPGTLSLATFGCMLAARRRRKA
jgi:uncharacterized membrane protein